MLLFLLKFEAPDDSEFFGHFSEYTLADWFEVTIEFEPTYLFGGSMAECWPPDLEPEEPLSLFASSTLLLLLISSLPSIMLMFSLFKLPPNGWVSVIPPNRPGFIKSDGDG